MSGVVDFPKPEITPEERARRLKVEVERLASLPVAEWLFYLESDDIAEKHGLSRAVLKEMIDATIKVNEKKAREDKAEDRQLEQRAVKERDTARREQEREQARTQREEQREQKETERKRKEREKEFAVIAKLPRMSHEARLAEVAKRLGEDLDFLRDEFADYVGPESGDTGHFEPEPWDEPVDTKALLVDLMAQLRRYVALDDDAAVAVTLWTPFAWVHEIAVHSPVLVATSAEPYSGKTTLLGVLGYLMPRPYSAIELTGSNIYRIVDHLKPTLLIDEADKLFDRKPARAEIVNAGWTKGTKIPRMIRGGEIYQFDPFCPKAIGMIGLSLSSALASRCIIIKLWPKLPSEQTTDFRYVDNDDFVTLRRKFLRWAADNAAALRDAEPAVPPGFDNRLRMNWRLLLAIADLAGGTWPKQAREAAVKLSSTRHRPSEGVQLLAALRPLFAAHEYITSEDVVAHLNADPTGDWCNFRNHGPITQRQVAALLKPYDIFPVVLHPTKRAGFSRRGYQRKHLTNAFARFLPLHDPNIRTSNRRQ